MFQTPITIREAVNHIKRNEYVLPAIQREFEWGQDRIVGLFDSLMRGYPISSFLFWRVDKEHCTDFQFYSFLREFHERDCRHNQKINLTGNDAVVAVLDGQQRLTSLYIGLLGTHATRTRWRRRTTNAAYLKRRLYLNLLEPAEDTEAGLRYDLEFLTDAEAAEPDPHAHWFLVGDILKFKDLSAIIDYIVDNKLTASKFPKDCLVAIYKAICDQGVVNYYLETEQNLDKVLNIFIRINSGGMKLSYSDILLSIATSQWRTIDAREVTHELVDDLNRTGMGFEVEKDFVLKSCLVLADIGDIKFNVLNFRRENMDKIEQAWPSIDRALHMAVGLASSFGFTGRTLTANYSLLPIAYYLLKRGLPANYIDGQSHAADRKVVRGWLIRSLLKRGTFGSGLDTTLRGIREALKAATTTFPVVEVEAEMARIGKTLRFVDEEIEELLDLEYGKTFGVLALLFPTLDLKNKFHEHHIFPNSRFTAKRLMEAGVPESQVSSYLEKVNTLPNLQLLEGTPNQEKQAKLPGEWLDLHFKGEDQKRKEFVERNYLPLVPPDITGFLAFYEARRSILRAKLRELLVPEPQRPLSGPALPVP